MSSPNHKPALTIAAAVVVSLLVLVSIWVRAQIAGSDPLWLDELHTVWTTSHGWDEVSTAAAQGNQAPLYFWLQKLFAQPDLTNPISHRLLSIISSGVTIISVGWIVWYWSRSPIAAVMAVALATVDDQFIFYGSEARPYATLMLFAVWQFHLFARIMLRGKSSITSHTLRNENAWTDWLLLWVLTTAMLATHPTGILLVASELMTSLLLIAFFKPRTNCAQTIATLGLATLFSYFLQQGSMNQVYDQRMQWNSLSSPLSLLEAYVPLILVTLFLPLIILVAAFRSARLLPGDRSKQLWLTAACGLGPMLVAIFLHSTQLAPVAVYRYTVSGAILLPLFAGFVVGMLSRTGLQIAALVAVVVSALWLPTPKQLQTGWSFQPANELLPHTLLGSYGGRPPRLRFENWDSALALLNGTNKPVFLFSNLLEDNELIEIEKQQATPSSEFLDYLRFPLTCSREVEPNLVIPRPSHHSPSFTGSHIHQIRASSGCWIVVRGDHAMQTRILSELNQRLVSESERYQIHAFDELKPNQVPRWLRVYEVRRNETE